MSISKSHRSALILIDIQKGFDNVEYLGGQRNNPNAENNAGELLEVWRKKLASNFSFQKAYFTVL